MQKQNLENQNAQNWRLSSIWLPSSGLGKTPQNTKHGSRILLIYILDLN